jgi:hypothetical protein
MTPSAMMPPSSSASTPATAFQRISFSASVSNCSPERGQMR